jgi:hypothetical protein
LWTRLSVARSLLLLQIPDFGAGSVYEIAKYGSGEDYGISGVVSTGGIFKFRNLKLIWQGPPHIVDGRVLIGYTSIKPYPRWRRNAFCKQGGTL